MMPPAMLDEIGACLRRAGVAAADRMAVQLVGFLRLKVVTGDVGVQYEMSPPAAIDACWHALVLETSLYSRVCRAVGAEFIHHSALQHGSRHGRLLKFAEAIEVSWVGDFDLAWGYDPAPFFTQGVDSWRNRRRRIKRWLERRRTFLFHKVHVKTLNGKTGTFAMNSLTTVHDLKTMICAEWGVPNDQQRLIFNGRELVDVRTMRDEDVTDDSSLYLVLKLRGC